MKLYQRAKTGKVKFIELWTEGPFLCTKWGTIGSKIQESRKECEAKNPGKTNATTAEQQAEIEMLAKIKKKMDNGYVENLDEVSETAVTDITLDNLPKQFCPCKPVNKAPKKVLDDPDTYGQRKRDGHCIILVKTENSECKVYSRGMENISEYMLVIPEVQKGVLQLSPGTMLLTEFCFVKNKKDSTREIAKLVRKKDKNEVLKRYHEAAQNGSFEIAPFDIMFHEGEFIGNKTYRERHAILMGLGYNHVPHIIDDWKFYVQAAKQNGWEGFVLRNDKDSTISYSLNGKADRQGSYKYVFVHNDDFIVTSAEKGKAGKQTGLYAQFNVAQYLQDGTLLDCGNVGPGKLKHDRLAELTSEIDSGQLKFPFTIQVEFRDRHMDSGKLVFPQFEEVRYDKKPDECVTDFKPEV